MADEIEPDTRDNVVSRAVATRARLQQELREVEVFLSLYQKFTRGPAPGAEPTIVSDDEDATYAVSLGLEVRPEQPSAVGFRQPGMRQTEFEPFARAIILEHGRPMQKHELLQAIHAKGRRVGGHSEIETLKSKLWRGKERIINITGSGYWPFDVSCKAVSYVAESTATSNSSDATNE